MLLIPAIDIKGGHCVRLKQGSFDETTIYDTPLNAARRWVEAGAKRLHIVDLDGAQSGRPIHLSIIADICAKLPHTPIQLGGGVRAELLSDILSTGVSAVIISTSAIEDPQWAMRCIAHHPNKIILGLDARDGLLASNAWMTQSDIRADIFAASFAGLPLAGIVYTDIHRDGMLSGIDWLAMRRFAITAPAPVIVAGGLRSMDDIRRLGQCGSSNIIGAITGRAIYDGTIDFAEAQRLLAETVAATP